MRPISLLLPLLCLTLASSLALGKEPTNLASLKQELVLYHDSGEYVSDINKVMEEATRYLKEQLAQASTAGKKTAVVLDIDETSLSNYPNMLKLNFGGTLDQIRKAEKEGKSPAIAPTLAFYHYAKANKVAVFFVTGRHPDANNATVKNLKTAGYKNWDGLFFKTERYWKQSAATYKIDVRKQLTELGYNIVLNIGDQQSDLDGGYAEKSLKLPGPYYLIP